MGTYFRPVCRRQWRCQFCNAPINKGTPYFEHQEFGDRSKPGAKQGKWSFAECLRCAKRAGRTIPEEFSR